MAVIWIALINKFTFFPSSSSSTFHYNFIITLHRYILFKVKTVTSSHFLKYLLHKHWEYSFNWMSLLLYNCYLLKKNNNINKNWWELDYILDLRDDNRTITKATPFLHHIYVIVYIKLKFICSMWPFHYFFVFLLNPIQSLKIFSAWHICIASNLFVVNMIIIIVSLDRKLLNFRRAFIDTNYFACLRLEIIVKL